eukprot:CAMPEP_0174735970 /NCGR_PEP_ID=MMETSP1094-20130205/65882_1 /TAXON_ID=156173 /ORGANISM="Chrysochromulina brevifilum, Strain UTEX LB 985" /LENGTH=43 /DNA_ID= /DNA_START= /DNA_END= /DNA_ORIENTATION=
MSPWDSLRMAVSPLESGSGGAPPRDMYEAFWPSTSIRAPAGIT